MASPCPHRYLVAKCSTRSAPCDSGLWLIGVARVLSTTTRPPAARVRSAAGRDIDDLEGGVRGGLQVQQIAALGNAPDNGAVIGVDHDTVHTEARQNLGKQKVRGAVGIADRHGALPGPQQRQQGRADRGHAGWKGGGGRCALEGRDPRLETPHCRVCVAAVAVGGRARLNGSGPRLQVREGEGSALDDWLGDRPSRSIGMSCQVNRTRRVSLLVGHGLSSAGGSAHSRRGLAAEQGWRQVGYADRSCPGACG